MSQDEGGEDYDVLHIGNLIGILSNQHGYVVGRIAYRDDTMLRIIPQETSNKAIEFPMTEDGTEFAPELGVSEIELIERQESPYYVDFLGAQVGDMVAFFTVDGEEAAPAGKIAEVVKTAKRDGLVLEDGRVYSFRGQGPKLPVAVVRVQTEITEAADAQAGAEAEDIAAAERRTAVLNLLRGVLPTATVEVIPTGERSYPDSMQREDLFQDLLAEVSAKQRTNPRRIRIIQREVDLAVALKNRSVTHDAAGRILGPAPHLISTLGEAIENSKEGLPAAIPVVSAARVLNLDKISEGEFKASDVAPSALPEIINESEELATLYLEGALPERVGRGFDAYMMDLLGRDQAVLAGKRAGKGWSEAQDVIRTASLDEPVQGLSSKLPAYEPEKAPPVTLDFLIRNVTDRNVRVLPATLRKDVRTGAEFTIAPSDPNIVSHYVMLPTKAAFSLRPPQRPGDLPTALLYSAALQDDNLPTIERTLLDLYTDEAGSPLHAWVLGADATAEYQIADWLEKILPYAVHPAEAMGPRTMSILSLLDTIGLGSTDLAPAVTQVIRRWVRQSQRTWIELVRAHRDAVKKSLDAEEARIFQSVADIDAPLWSALGSAEPLKDLMEDIQRRNPTIAAAPTLLTAALSHEAQGDAAPLVWHTIATMDNRTLDYDVVAAVNALAASRAYQLRRKALRDLPLLRLRASPEINPCPHVSRLEAIHNVPDTLQRSRLLREFIETYQGGRNGEWMTCVLCRADAVCYHELMELEALAQPARMDAIQRQILIRYGGERYEGKIICRNCGQGLQDIEYDDHVEFDDNGNPIVASSVLTEEQLEAPTESTWRKATAALAPATLTFPTQSLNEIHEVLQTVLKEGNIIVDPAVIRTIVEYTDLYTSKRAPDRAVYEKKREQDMKKATTARAIPPYQVFINNIRISALMALLAIYIQIANPPIVINNPVAVCGRFSREGWPLKADGDPLESGPMRYVSCVVALIDKAYSPWEDYVWHKLDKIDARKNATLKAALGAASMIVKNETGLDFSTLINARLEVVRTDVDAMREQEMVSLTDQLPAGFRPEPFPPRVSRPAIEQTNVAGLVADEKTMASVTDALIQQAHAVIGELHEAAMASFPAGAPKGVNMAACCTATVAEVREGALLGAPEAPSLLAARAKLRDALPTAVNAGTHLWPAFETPLPSVVEQEVDPSIFYKLFLRFCYRGPAVGEAHEFSVGNICRQCGLVLGKPLDLIDFGTEGAGILAAQQGDLKIEVTQAAFDGLSDAVRRRRILTPPPDVVAPSWRLGLEAVAAACLASREDSMRACGDALNAVLEKLTGQEDAVLDETSRADLWMPVTEIYDSLRATVSERLGPGTGAVGQRADTRRKELEKALRSFDTLTRDPFQEGPRVVQEYWCTQTQTAGTGHIVDTVNGARWFKISTEHNEKLNKIMSDNAHWYGGTMVDGMKPVLRRIGQALGPVLRVWVRAVRPATNKAGPWTDSDAQYLLRCLVLQAWADAVTPTSWMYADAASVNTSEETALYMSDWTMALMIHASRQYIRFSSEEIKRQLQKRAELERTSIVAEFDQIKDDDERAAALLIKQFRIGRWSRGANIQKLDSDTFEFETEQRRRMGIIDPPVDPLVLQSRAPAGPEDFGLGAGAAEPEAGYDAYQGAEGDDY